MDESPNQGHESQIVEQIPLLMMSGLGTAVTGTKAI